MSEIEVVRIGKASLMNCDCMEYLATLPDNAFELAICDPPYGIGVDWQKLDNTNKNPKHNRKFHEFKGWDNEIPSPEYFKELKRVSKNQIIWGGNYFTDYLPPTKAWVFWFKGQRDLSMSDGEMAWTSFNKVTRQIELNRFFNAQGCSTIHPTQKPIKLYEWLLTNYAKPGDRILDTHLGSMSSVIACENLGFEIVGCELDKEYFDAGCQRVRDSQRQATMFEAVQVQKIQNALI